jgi:2-polyprenyl-6-methoxyphenol hydroxylase-like FAD-dependent oxidoreductase
MSTSTTPQVGEISVLIVGAGPTGLTLACELARRGVDFRIVDKAAAYFAGSRGKGLQPRSLEVLNDLGVVEKILANGRFHLPFRAYDGTTAIGERDLHEGRNPTPDVPYASPLIIPQWRVEEILRGRLAELGGGKVELATELVALEQDAEIVTATLQHADQRSQLRARYVVAADGGRSFVRKHLNVGFEGETWKDERMLVGDVHVDALDRDHWHSWGTHQGGWVALCPFSTADTFQFQAQIPPDMETEPSLELFQSIVDERTGRSDLKLYDPTWLSLYQVNVRMVNQYRIGQVFLAGDAAHVHSPAGGQGMNTGIQDACNLAWKLSAVLHGADGALLDTYEEERLPIAASMLGITTRLHRQAFDNNSEGVKRGPETLQLGLNYRQCSLSQQQDQPATPLRAGDRAPDAPLRNAKGREVTLFDAFRGPHFTLLSFGVHDREGLEQVIRKYSRELRTYTVDRIAPDSSASDTALFDVDGHASNAYGGENEALFLIRPDGYVGFIGSEKSIGAIDAYLERVHGREQTARQDVGFRSSRA